MATSKLDPLILWAASMVYSDQGSLPGGEKFWGQLKGEKNVSRAVCMGNGRIHMLAEGQEPCGMEFYSIM